MTRADSIGNLKHALRTLLPPRPELDQRQRVARFLIVLFGSLLITIFSLNLLNAIGAPKGLSAGVALAWMFFLVIGSPVMFYLRARDADRLRKAVGRWQLDPRRLAAERLGLDLAIGRLPGGMNANDLLSLDAAAGDWRQCREALGALSDDVWLSNTCRELGHRADEAMLNLLAEAGAASSLGPAPFSIERARSLFSEIATEARALGRRQAAASHVSTDASLESLREGLDQLRELRLATDEMRRPEQPGRTV